MACFLRWHDDEAACDAVYATLLCLSRQGTIETFDRKYSMKLYSLATTWEEREINFECATPVFGLEYTKLDGGPWLVEQVELSIKNVLRTLQFDRMAAR